MDLRRLEYAVAVAEHGGFGAAARNLRVSQPTLSHGVRRLEIELGVELFARLGRSVALTPAGEHVVAAARNVLVEVANVRAAAAAVTELEQGTLEIVALPTLTVDPLAGLIGAFRTAHPGVAMRIHEPEESGGVERRVRAGDAELGLTDVGAEGRGLVRIELFRQEIVAVSPPGSAGDSAAGATTAGGTGPSSAGPLSAAELARLPLIVTPPGTSTRRLLDRTLARIDAEPQLAVELNHREAMVALVMAGAGTCLLPRPLADDAAARGAIVRRLRPPLTRRIGIVHRRARLTPAASALVRLAREALDG